ncbi:hypothetical protein VWX97_17995 [Phaeobacter sp. JH18-32]|uniref:hypothetical protein n=1 Tax=Phaeobacter TaxID=302485 RepID=UPI0030C9B6B9
MRLLPCLALTLLPLPAFSSDYWEYQDWSVAADMRVTEEHDWRDCTAWTGGDGLPLLRLTVTEGDVGPPETYPQLELFESAARHYPTQVQNGQAIGFIIDQKAVFYGIADAEINEEGIAEARAMVRWMDALNTILWMQDGDRMEVRTVVPYGAGEMVLDASLAGFTAAYGKMMDECGHSLELRKIEIDYN